MPIGRRSSLLNGLAVLIVLATLASIADTASSVNVGCTNNTQCGCHSQNCTLPTDGGMCVNGTCQCNVGYSGLNCTAQIGACCGVAFGAQGAEQGEAQADGCAGGPGVPCSNAVSLAACLQQNGTWAGPFTNCASGICDPTSTPTPTSTATSTPTQTATETQTPIPQGGGCVDTSQCAAGLSCNQVCCDQPCTAPGTSCVLPGQVGTCAAVPAAAAPAASHSGLLLMLGALLGVGAAALALRKRS